MHGVRGACPSLVGFMQNVGLAIGLCALLLAGIVLVRGIVGRCFNLFPLFYSYMIYAFCGSLLMYLIYWTHREAYPTAYWFYYLVSILVEFTVIVEISDQIFRPFPAIRNLGRALTIVISAALGIVYMLPAVLWSPRMSIALLDFALRASVTKAAVLAALLIATRHYGSELGKNVAGLMLGFSLYLGINVANLAAARLFGRALYGEIYFMMTPIGYLLCLLVWTIALWERAPLPNMGAMLPVAGDHSEAVALQLTRFNSELSKILHK